VNADLPEGPAEPRFHEGTARGIERSTGTVDSRVDLGRKVALQSADLVTRKYRYAAEIPRAARAFPTICRVRPAAGACMHLTPLPNRALIHSMFHRRRAPDGEFAERT
jgi:hypothetical protein